MLNFFSQPSLVSAFKTNIDEGGVATLMREGVGAVIPPSLNRRFFFEFSKKINKKSLKFTIL